jgi:uroporphyrinogen-III synthase
MSTETIAGGLSGRHIALFENRELDRLAAMLEGQGAVPLRCPMVAIVDPPDPQPISDWLQRLPTDDLVLLTGEGVRRLHGAASRLGRERGFLDALRQARKITRGPKPARALREFGLKPDLAAEIPTTEGIIAVLSGLDLRGRRVGVQLYPDSPKRLVEFLHAAGAEPDPVLPYAYSTAVAEERVAALIDRMARGEVDAIVFTSSPQVRRLFEAAAATGRQEALRTALETTAIAAVGPVVAAELGRRGVDVSITPDRSYFMKPLVTAIVAALSG